MIDPRVFSAVSALCYHLRRPAERAGGKAAAGGLAGGYPSPAGPDVPAGGGGRRAQTAVLRIIYKAEAQLRASGVLGLAKQTDEVGLRQRVDSGAEGVGVVPCDVHRLAEFVVYLRGRYL